MIYVKFPEDKFFMAFLIVAGSITIGSAIAAENFAAPVKINSGPLIMIDGTIDQSRTDGVQTLMKLKNSQSRIGILFEDTTGGEKYEIQQNGDGSRFQFQDPNFSNRKDISINTLTGNIGIGKPNPTERLDVLGNIKLSGNILSNGDICIGAC